MVAEKGLNGPYNVTRPARLLSMGQLLETCREATAAKTAFTWVSDSFLVENEVAAFMEMPLWVTEADRGILQVNVSKALRDGLVIRPLPETILDTLSWTNSRPTSYSWRAGLAADREQDLLDRWHAR